MDPITIIGVIVAFVSILVGMILEGGNPASLISPSAFLIVIPSTLGVAVAGGYMGDIKTVIAGLKIAFMSKPKDPAESIETLVGFADKARREGLLALEDAVKEVDDEFLKRGIEMAIDGTDPEELREILEAELEAKKSEVKHAMEFFMACGSYAPTIGIIGTCLGLIHVLHNLTDAAALGPAISAAFVATLFGVGTANLIYIPIGSKLKRVAVAESAVAEAVVEGVASIQAGSNPRIIQQKLSALLGVEKDEAKDKAA